MIRILKVLALVLVALIATCAAVASAQMDGELTSDGPVTLKGSGWGSSTMFGGTSECSQGLYTGHKITSTPSVPIPSGATSITLTASEWECTTLNFPSVVEMEGCDFEVHFGGTIDVHKYSAKTTIICPPGKHITEKVFSSVHNRTTGKSFCHITLTENPEGYGGLTVTESTKNNFTITGTITEIDRDKFSPTGSVLCQTETQANAMHHVAIGLGGLDQAGNKTEMLFSHQ